MIGFIGVVLGSDLYGKGAKCGAAFLQHEWNSTRASRTACPR